MNTEQFGLVMATALPTTNYKNNKNGDSPLYLNVIAGKFPNRNLLDGTIAKNMGVNAHETYLFSIKETEEDVVHGRRFSWTIVRKVTAISDIISGPMLLGKAEKVVIYKPGEAPVGATTEFVNAVQQTADNFTA